MNDYFLKLYAFNHGYCQRLIEDISEEEMLVQPTAGVNTPAWLVGHLALCTDFALGILEAKQLLSREWQVNFGPGTSPLPGKRPFPSKQELWDAYSKGHTAVEAVVSKEIDAQLLAAVNPVEFLQAALPTAGDLLAHLLTTHESLHLGHLSNWRRQTGRVPLF